MPSNKKLLQAAAGNAGGESLYVEDVFSTYLYDGTGATQVIENGIALGDSNYGSSVEFDGVADYVSRNSGLTGQSDSHTFTLSIWVFNAVPSGYARIFGIKNSSGSNNILYLQIDSNNYLNVMTITDGVSQIQGIDAGNSPPGYTVPRNTWSNILISANLATSTWHLSINDSYSSVTPYNPSGLTDNIDFSTSSGSTVGTLYGSYFKGRITQLYLDNTFRDLSQTSVRRTFINSDGTPATGLASLNPVLYLPLDDTNSVGTNLGTGGAYSVSGSPTQLSEGGPYIESGFGKGGMVWIKCRNTAFNNIIFDTERGAPNALLTNTTDQNISFYSDSLTSFNSDGFSLGADTISFSVNNGSNRDYCSWTFRKAEKFFDVVTYTGNGVAGRTVAHNLGSVPGCIIVKMLTLAGYAWRVYHVGANGGVDPQNYAFKLNDTTAQENDTYWNNTAPTSTEFTVNNYGQVNASGESYVAYLFASDAGGFGADGSESIIKCGSYEGNGLVDGPSIDLGWEPQYLIIKNADGVDDWKIYDSMRGIVSGGDGSFLAAQSSTTETALGKISLNANGFKIDTNFALLNASANTFIYIAIRRPMKTPESGTEVFSVDDRAAATPAFVSDFPVDLYWTRAKTGGTFFDYARLRGDNYLQHDGTNAETSGAAYFDSNTGVGSSGSASTDNLAWMFKRATGFFDVVAYTGTGVSSQTFNHNLGVVPELMIIKCRSQAAGGGWLVYSQALGNNSAIVLNDTGASFTPAAYWNTTSPTDSVFSVNADTDVGNTGRTYVSYLFATLAGVSKVGSYTGTGSNVNVDCGFSAGARFILIKRTDSTGDWYVYDYFRGIVSGNDPYLLLNTGTGEVTSTDYIDPLSSGFTVTSSAPAALNASGGSYIFLAIA
jgi:hypothetical protein